MLTLEQVKLKSGVRLAKLHPAVLTGANELIRRSYNRGCRSSLRRACAR
ncbi:hypothetical protein ACFTAO_34270 [Paenibacillus rhizoplanae]